jgi:hypothetical protein
MGVESGQKCVYILLVNVLFPPLYHKANLSEMHLVLL